MPDTWIIALIVIGIVILVVGVIFLLWWFSSIHSMRRMSQKVDNSESKIDAAVAQKIELLVMEASIARRYAKLEAIELKKLVNVRQPEKNAHVADKSAFAIKLNDSFASLDVIAQRYPDLVVNSDFINLKNRFVDAEENLQAARRIYNSNVSTFNQRISGFPQNKVASHYGLLKRDYFETEEPKE